MIKEIIFPNRKDHKYWNQHFKYIINSAEYAGIKVKIDNISNIKRGSCNLGIPVLIDSKYCIFDFQNTEECEYREPICPVFKFHYNSVKATDSNVYPFGTSCFLDWDQYYFFKDKIKYKAKGFVLNNQKEYNKDSRRRIVRNILKDSSFVCDFSITNKEKYWNKFSNCSVHVFVGGHHEHSLDRAHLQALAFGVCTLSTEIYEELPFKKLMIPYYHYIPLKEDYTDLVDKLSWCKSNLDTVKKIGYNASQLFKECIEPKNIWKYVERCING